MAQQFPVGTRVKFTVMERGPGPERTGEIVEGGDATRYKVRTSQGDFFPVIADVKRAG